MKEEIIEYEGEKIKVITFETKVHINQSMAKILAEIDALMTEEEDTLSGKRLIKRLKS